MNRTTIVTKSRSRRANLSQPRSWREKSSLADGISRFPTARRNFTGSRLPPARERHRDQQSANAQAVEPGALIPDGAAGAPYQHVTVPPTDSARYPAGR